MESLHRIRASRRSLLTASAASAALALVGGVTAPVSPARASQFSPSATPNASTPVAGGDFAALDAYVQERMAALTVPGVAVGVILGEQEYTAGFGVTNVDHPLPVDADTLFQIGSTTKAVTGTTLMRLIESGQVDFDAPVRRYLPDFRVADDAVAEAVLVRHLVTHTAGWYGDEFTETGDGDDALARFVDEMADLPQIAPLGAFLSYNNAAVVTEGRLIEIVTGQPYEAAVKELVLAPLGMERSFFFPEEFITEVVATGHDAQDGRAVVTGPFAFPRAVNPAGGIVASARDMLRYAQFHLGDGTAGGERVLSADALRQMQTPLGPGGALGPDLLDGVGVNWLLSTVGGARVVQHGGSTNGQQSTFVLVPERGFALSVLTNANLGAVLATQVAEWALDAFLGLRNEPLSQQTLPSSLAAEVTADYGDPATTSISVANQDGALVATPKAGGEPLPGEEIVLEFVGDDRFISDYHGIPVYTDLVRDSEGQVGWLRFSGRLMPIVRTS